MRGEPDGLKQPETARNGPKRLNTVVDAMPGSRGTAHPGG
jgi:hypothetical protein